MGCDDGTIRCYSNEMRPSIAPFTLYKTGSDGDSDDFNSLFLALDDKAAKPKESALQACVLESEGVQFVIAYGLRGNVLDLISKAHCISLT